MGRATMSPKYESYADLKGRCEDLTIRLRYERNIDKISTLESKLIVIQHELRCRTRRACVTDGRE
jgi:hypothetical protein